MMRLMHCVSMLCAARALQLDIDRRSFVRGLSAAALAAPPAATFAAPLAAPATAAPVGSAAPPAAAPSEANAGVAELPSGVRYRAVSEGRGAVPAKGDVVAVRLRGLLPNDRVFLDARAPILFRVGSVVSRTTIDGPVTPAVDIAVARMRAGERGHIVAPPDSAYPRGLSIAQTRAAGLSGLWIPSDETLRYEIELLRCLEVDVGEARGRACCSEADYPCRANGE